MVASMLPGYEIGLRQTARLARVKMAICGSWLCREIPEIDQRSVDLL
jgi:hypothetical protein